MAAFQHDIGNLRTINEQPYDYQMHAVGHPASRGRAPPVVRAVKPGAGRHDGPPGARAKGAVNL
jgi:hypothetical protein